MTCYKILNFSSFPLAVSFFSPTTHFSNTQRHKHLDLDLQEKKKKKETMSSKEEEREVNDLMAQFMAGDSSVCT